MAAQFYRETVEYLKKFPGTFYVGPKDPKVEKVKNIPLRVLPLFDPRNALGDSKVQITQVIGIFDEQNQEHILVFDDLKAMQVFVQYLYSSSHIIHRRWYEVTLIN
ncbi:MAG: hypothetical protein JSR58_07060 [Verrucomicrobia bacterium]|nr:hypothetical protein [Verrucomicrobiota bacterium]